MFEEFYKRVEECDIIMVNQPSPQEFGDAVLRTRLFMTDKVFLVHAGDAVISSNRANNVIKIIIQLSKTYT